MIKKILLKTILIFAIILPLYMFLGVKESYAITCSRCSSNYKYAWAVWPSGPDNICDTADDDYGSATYTCNCSCTTGTGTDWSGYSSCQPCCQVDSCSGCSVWGWKYEYMTWVPYTDCICGTADDKYEWGTSYFPYCSCTSGSERPSYDYQCDSCTSDECPSGTQTGNTGCSGSNYSCTVYDICNNACATSTIYCYDNPVTTSAPPTPSYSGIRTYDGSYYYNQLSTSSSSPTPIDFSAISSTDAYTEYRPTNGGYNYKAYDAFTSGTQTLNYDGTTRYVPFTTSSVGRIESRHYQYRCPNYSGTKYYSGIRYGYYCDDSCDGTCTPTCPAGMTTTNTGPDCLTTTYSSCSYFNDCNTSCNVQGDVCYYEETNTPPASPPASVILNVNTESYTLSTDPANPTKIKYPPAGAIVTVEAPTDTGIDGYKFVADNYGVSDQWVGGTECQGIDGEDFCTEGTSNTQSFDPYTKTAAEVLLENAEGKISAYYYTENDCDSGKEYSNAITGYYTVMPIPTASYYRIEVNTASDFTGVVMWDSGKTSMTTINAGQRSSSQIYAGSTLSGLITYHWKIKFWDQDDNESPWSSTANFKINRDPTAPTSLMSSTINPPEFSAVYNDPDATDTSSYYEIEVNTSSDFTGTIMWDSEKTSMTTTNQGSRSPDIIYGGNPLSVGVIYYWRIRFWDSDDQVSPWSSTSTLNLNVAPSSPTDLLTEGQTNPIAIKDTTPEFSAIYNDPDTDDTSSYYEIEVNTASDFTGTVMWDSGKLSMTTTNQGQRSPDISYAGSTLSTEITYYWRIKFWDSNNNESPWSSTANFKIDIVPTATDLLIIGETNPTQIFYDIYFSAIYTDPNLDDSSAYQIQVNTSNIFDGTIMWDSTKTPTTISSGNRSSDIYYEGTDLEYNGTTYYVRMKFWDTDDNVSNWVTGQFTDTLKSFQFNGLQINGIQLN